MFVSRMDSSKQFGKRPLDTVSQLHQKIIALGEQVRSQAASAEQNNNKSNLSPSKTVKFVEPEIPVPQPLISMDIADNQYAEEIFMCKTNIRDIARNITERKGYANTEKVLRKFRKKLYRLYASDPKTRIREPLEKVRFESQYYEYRFFLALNKPLHSEEEYHDYKAQLDAAGVAESWVSMPENNLLLAYEDRVIKRLKRDFSSWSLKLDKLDSYLMHLYLKKSKSTSHPKVDCVNVSEDEQLLEKILLHSNAKDMLSEAQIRAMFTQIKYNLLSTKKVGFEWLTFDDDELNKRYHLGKHRLKIVNGNEATTVSLEENKVSSNYHKSKKSDAPPVKSMSDFEQLHNRSVSNGYASSLNSCDSELAQMRSEMAMTQPQDLLPIAEAAFEDTHELLNVLGTLQQASLSGESVTESVANDNVHQELSPLITPAQVELIEISDSPVKDDEMVEVKEEFIYTLEYMRKYTNMEQLVIEEINKKSPKKVRRCMKNLDVYIERYYELRKSKLLQNVLPKELRILTRKERREREAKALSSQSETNQSNASSVRSKSMEQPVQADSNQQRETPALPRIVRRSRRILYEEDDTNELAKSLPADTPNETLSMPHSEDFIPTVFSTQLSNHNFTLPRRQDTPFQSPAKQNTPQNASITSSRGPTPSFVSHSPNATVIMNPNEKSPNIKTELNATSYEGEVEFVELSNGPIELHDSMDVTSQNIPELLNRQPSCMAALPDNLRGLVNTLFRENHDISLSQGSRNSDGSGRSNNSQDTANASAPSLGFQQAVMDKGGKTC